MFFPVNHMCDGWGCFPTFRGLACGWPARSVCCCSLSVNTNRILQFILHNRLNYFPLLFVNEFLCYWHISENFPTETARLFIRRRALVAADGWRHSAATVSSGVTRFYLFCFHTYKVRSEPVTAERSLYLWVRHHLFLSVTFIIVCASYEHNTVYARLILRSVNKWNVCVCVCFCTDEGVTRQTVEKKSYDYKRSCL